MIVKLVLFCSFAVVIRGKVLSTVENEIEMKAFFTLLILCFSLTTWSQGTVRINYGSDIQGMKQKFISHNKSQETVKAWRIQIITTDDRRRMENTMAKFSSMYPDINLEWKHIPPYYKVKVGAYENKMKLMPFLLELKPNFPGVIPIMENIRKTSLVK